MEATGHTDWQTGVRSATLNAVSYGQSRIIDSDVFYCLRTSQVDKKAAD